MFFLFCSDLWFRSGSRDNDTIMSQFQVSPPEKFSFKADDWPKWIKRFERFRMASGLETQAEENQVNALIYMMGEEAEDILTSLHSRGSRGLMVRELDL